MNVLVCRAVRSARGVDLNGLYASSSTPSLDWSRCGDAVGVQGGRFIPPEKSESLFSMTLLSKGNFEDNFDIYKNVSNDLLNAFVRSKNTVIILRLILSFQVFWFLR